VATIKVLVESGSVVKMGEVKNAGWRVALPGLLRMFWVGSAAAFVLMVLVGYVEYRMGFKQPHYNPLAGDRYQDLMEFPPVYRLVHTAAFFRGVGDSRVAYPPLGAVVYALVYGTGHPIGFYLGTAALWLAAGVWGVRRELVASGISGVTATLFPLTVALMSFPIAGLLQRGNIELFLWIIAAMGTWAFLRGHENWAAVLWGLAAAMKLYPVIFLALLLPRRKWGTFATGLATFAGATVLSMAWLGPTMAVAWQGSLRNVFGYQGARVSQWTLHELMANHTVFGLAKFGAMVSGVPLAKLTLPYYACGALVMALAFFGRLWRMPVANQLIAVTAFMVMLPPVSYFYTLVHLYAPWLVLVFVAIRADRKGVRLPGLKLTMLLFLPLFASFMLFSFPRVMLFGGLVQAGVLVALFLCALEYPFEVPDGEEFAKSQGT
jgi:Glycosyltransferase family 87